MVYYNPKNYTFLRVEPSHLASKKYDAILKNKATGREVCVSFGAKGYQQYKDKDTLKLYKGQDHNDKKRRDRYRARHANYINERYSSSWFSLKYLW